MARKITNRNTKAEILDAYSDIDGELKELRRQMRELKKEKAAVIEEAAATPALPIEGEAEEVSLLSVEQLLSALDALPRGLPGRSGQLAFGDRRPVPAQPSAGHVWPQDGPRDARAVLLDHVHARAGHDGLLCVWAGGHR